MQSQPSLIQYPCRFSIKVVGQGGPELADAVVAMVRQFDPDFDAAKIELRSSSKGNYVGITVTPYIKDCAQLDALYRVLTDYSLVKFVL